MAQPEHTPAIGDHVEMGGHLGAICAFEDRDGRPGACVEFPESEGREWFPLVLLHAVDETAEEKPI